MLEKDIEESILRWLNLQPGCFAFKLKVQGTWNKKGFYQQIGKFVPKGGNDVIFCLNGLFGGLEIKTPKAYKSFFQSPGDHELRQQAFINKIRFNGGFSEVVCSLEQAQELFIAFRDKKLSQPKKFTFVLNPEDF